MNVYIILDLSIENQHNFLMHNTESTGRIPSWLVGTFVGTAALAILATFFNLRMAC